VGYKKITNLQIGHPLFLFKEVYATEKLHGTSTHILFTHENGVWKHRVSSGGINHHDFIGMLNSKYKLATDVIQKLTEHTAGRDFKNITIYGEGYGGYCQNMGDIYGPINFAAFEVERDGFWLEVPRAHKFVETIGLPFVFYERGPATPEWLDAQRNRPSEQAKRNGMGDDKEGEGIVIRAPMELQDVSGGRLIAKYKRENFRETRTARPLTAEEIKKLEDAAEIAEEWVVEERLNHVLSKLVREGHTTNSMQATGLVIDTMVEDVSIEAAGQVEWSAAVARAVGRKTAELFHKRIKSGGITNPIANT